MIFLVLYLILIFIASYLFGSIPTGYLFVKKLAGVDIRETGSGSTGATNVKRVLGTKWFFVVLILDVIKGIIPVYLSQRYFNYISCEGLAPVLAAFGVILGHCKSVFLKFTGGKSVATGIGTLLALCWPVGLILGAIWASITFTTKYVSLGSIIAVSLAPILMTAFNQNAYNICFAAICAVFVIITHRENIKRLCNGTENKVRK
jgi:glycerol-3-phosphate acyltransferase PlsY